MTAEEWAEIKELFEAALKVPEAEREHYLAGACGEQEQIHRIVAELIENHARSSRLSFRASGSRPPALPDGELIAGRFRVLRFINSGGMGEVYEAYDEQLRLRLALKTLRPEIISEAGALERFKREIVVARGVSHENLCRVFDFIEHRMAVQGRVIPCFTMELLEGESLAEMLARERPVDPAVALGTIRQIAAGLSVLHAHGIVHRDLKPSNVMLTRCKNGETRAVVMDFGLAKPEEGDSDFFESLTGFDAGAPYFMAPELLRKQRPSVASDVYAFGLMLDEMVTRSPAFAARSLQALYYAKLWEQPMAPSARANQLPAHWERAIERCLDIDPRHRFEHVLDVVRALENPESSAAEPGANDAAGKRRLPRRALLLGALSVPAVGGAAAVAALAFQPVKTSIEVFEIDNQSNQAEYDYLCKGTANELMRRLLQLPEVNVIPRYAPRSGTPASRAARFALDGMLQAYNGQIRLSMQLIDNQAGTLVWSDNFDRRQMESPLDLQSEIARASVAALENRVLAVGSGGRERQGMIYSAAARVRRWFSFQAAAGLAAPPTQSNAAFDLYMRGYQLLEERSAAGTTAAIDCFGRAIEQDPNFALAYASAAEAYGWLMNFNYFPHPDLAQKASYYARTAVERDATLAEAHAVLGVVYQNDWNWKGSEDEYREALRLKPRLARARRWYAGLILQFRRFDEAIAQAREALEQDPYDRAAPAAFGLYLFFAGRYHEAVNVLTAALRNQDMVVTRHNLCEVYARLGYVTSGVESAAYYGAAIEQAQAVARVERADHSAQGQASFSDQLFAQTYAMQGDWAAARPYIDRIESQLNTGVTSPAMLARIYAIERQPERALDLLDQAVSIKDRRLLYIKVYPYFENLRGETRFQQLVAAMGL